MDPITMFDTAATHAAQVAEAIAEMFISHMPELGRQAGFVGPEIPVPTDGTAADRLLGAMGRDPGR